MNTKELNAESSVAECGNKWVRMCYIKYFTNHWNAYNSNGLLIVTLEICILNVK